MLQRSLSKTTRRVKLPGATNLDIAPVPEAARELGENVELFQDAKRDWKTETWYGDLGTPMRDGSPTRVDQGVAFISMADLKQAWSEGRSVGPIGYANGRLVFPDHAREAMRQGYQCGNPECFQLQEVPGSEVCKIKGKSYGCGWVRGSSSLGY